MVKERVDPPVLPSAASTVANKASQLGLQQLFEGDPCIVDIVFVHGLTGDREKTWTAEGAGAPWISALLPIDLPNTRIFTFGYDADVVDLRSMVSRNRIADHATNLLTDIGGLRDDDGTDTRPLMFVAHSLGGLVCADMLVASAHAAEPYLQKVHQFTSSIAFLSTPHHGSNLAKWATMLALSIGVVKQTNAEIIAVLKNDSEVLARIQHSFHALVRSRHRPGLTPINITPFYEELDVAGVGVIVDHQSAKIPGYTPIGIYSDHKNMTKFSSREDPGYKKLVRELRRWIRELNHGHQTPVQSLPIASNTNFNLVPHREENFRERSVSRLGSEEGEEALLSHYIDHGEDSQLFNPERRIPSTAPLTHSTYATQPPRTSATLREPPGKCYQDSTEHGMYLEAPKKPTIQHDYPTGNSVQNIIFDVPLPRNPHFTGQEDKLKALETELGTYTASGYASFHRMVLTGMGGIGKTELAVQFANVSRHKFVGVFWVDATNRSSLQSGLTRRCGALRRPSTLFQRMAEDDNRALSNYLSYPSSTLYSPGTQSDTIARATTDQDRNPDWLASDVHSSRYPALSLPDIAPKQANDHITDDQSVLDWLASSRKPWLLVVDNMDDPDMIPIFESTLSHITTGFILVTTRNQEVSRLGTPIGISSLPLDSGLRMLLMVTNRGQDRTSTDEPYAAQLVERLGGLPLAIDQAGSYINFCHLSFEKYISLFENNTNRLLDKSWKNRYHTTKTEYLNGNYDTILKTFEISYMFVEKKNPMAVELLKLFAFLSFEHISEDLFANFIRPSQKEWSCSGCFETARSVKLPMTPQLTRCLTNEVDYGEAYGNLLSFSLMKRTATQNVQSFARKDFQIHGFRIHPLVHFWISARMSRDDKLFWLQLTAAFLCITIPPRQQLPALDNRDNLANLVPHIRQLRESASSLDVHFSTARILHVLYAAPYIDDDSSSSRTSEQLHRIAKALNDPFHVALSQLWELTDTCSKTPICQQRSLQILQKSLESFVDLRESKSANTSGGFNSLVLQFAFRFSLTLRSRKCDATTGGFYHDPCIEGVRGQWAEYIHKSIMSWRPITTSHYEHYEPDKCMECGAIQLHTIYIYAIAKTREEQGALDTLENFFYKCLRDYHGMMSICKPITILLSEYAQREHRSLRESIESLIRIQDIGKATAQASREIANSNATMVKRMLTSEHAEIRSSLPVQENIDRWIQFCSFLQRVLRWECLISGTGKRSYSHFVPWTGFASSLESTLRLPFDLFAPDSLAHQSVTISRIEEALIKWTPPDDSMWKSYVATFLRELGNYENRDKAISGIRASRERRFTLPKRDNTKSHYDTFGA